METGGAIIRRYRKKRGWLQHALGSRVGVSAPTISRIERGTLIPEDLVIKKIAIELNVEPEYLISTFYVAPFENYERLLTEINQQRQTGQPLFVTAFLPGLIKELTGLRGQYPKIEDRKRLDRLIAKSATLVVSAHLHTAPEHAVVRITAPYIELLKNINYALKNKPEDEEYFEIAKVLYPTVLFIAKKLEDSEELLRENIKRVSTSYPKSLCVRLPMFANALLADMERKNKKDAIERFKRDREIAFDALEKEITDPADRAKVYEGLSFAGGILGDPEAQNWIDSAKEEYLRSVKQGKYQYGVEVIVARTEFSNLIRNPEIDKNTIEDNAFQAVHLFVKGGYIRQESQVISKLISHPDKQLRELGNHLHHSSAS